MKTILKASALLLIVLLVSSCTQQKRKLDLPNIMLTTDYLIPHPVKLTATNSSFPLDQYSIITTSGEEGLEDVGQFLAEKIKITTNLDIPVNPGETKGIQTVISIQLKNDFETDNPEAYQLVIGENDVWYFQKIE